MVRYTLLRALVFLACLAALWLAGLRDRSEQPWLVVGAALLSMVVSFFVLRPFREDAVRSFEARRAAKETGEGEPRPTRSRRRPAVSDEDAEDADSDTFR
ncbi:hypothetical protein AWH69_13160 [Janibacter melonis]|uniref:DUF4229 domain-containing protein n=1 Tax=Janibacter melonis TaxID=262209 RepID=A0A176Q9D8_9MICO|nr:DUF4229 domain-containing protein [Janibacter melonis]OAB86294.1 hypothetical protein AWH69_13160 [Janibacter melonis]